MATFSAIYVLSISSYVDWRQYGNSLDNLGYPYNDLVICKDSPDYLYVPLKFA